MRYQNQFALDSILRNYVIRDHFLVGQVRARVLEPQQPELQELWIPTTLFGCNAGSFVYIQGPSHQDGWKISPSALVMHGGGSTTAIKAEAAMTFQLVVLVQGPELVCKSSADVFGIDHVRNRYCAVKLEIPPPKGPSVVALILRTVLRARALIFPETELMSCRDTRCCGASIG